MDPEQACFCCVPWNLTEFVEYNRSSINIKWMNEWMGLILQYPVSLLRKLFSVLLKKGQGKLKHRIIFVFGSKKASRAKPKIIGIYLIPTHWRGKKMPIKINPVNALIFCQSQEIYEWAGLSQGKECTHLWEQSNLCIMLELESWCCSDGLNQTVATEINWPFSVTKCSKCYWRPKNPYGWRSTRKFLLQKGRIVIKFWTEIIIMLYTISK